MTNKQELRSKARSASAGEWIKESGEGWEAICSSDDQANAGFIVAHFEGPDAKANREFIQAANPSAVLALLDELEAKDKRIAELERGSKVIKCWSCQKSVTVDQVKAEDGYCPLCDCGIDIEEYEIEELVADGIISRIEE
ncbi:hypothetical protein C3370_03860 [Leclercia sp. LSNIH7]|nr:hypothetical protein C3370_03860 [Leclercia sp. LSNIH7]